MGRSRAPTTFLRRLAVVAVSAVMILVSGMTPATASQAPYCYDEPTQDYYSESFAKQIQSSHESAPATGQV